MPAISPARAAAFQILMTIERGKGHSDDLLRGKSVTNLSPQDRNLATALVLGVLRWQIRLDHQVRAHLARPNARLDAEVLVALRIAAFQLLHLDRIPARAAIDESVELAKQAGHHFAARMVNAVLRKLAAAPPVEFPEDSVAHLALAFAHPAWLVERWTSSFGFEAAKDICRHGQQQPEPSIRITATAAEDELAQQEIVLQSGLLLTAARTLSSGDITATAAFREGRIRVQDEGSQLVAEITGIAASNRTQSQAKILDCCAAPGGKTLILAERNPMAHIVACEASPQRLAQLRERLAGHDVDCRLADATTLADDGLYDLVLADVPCSGTGTLGRNPEIRHRLKPDDLPRQAQRQRDLLATALRAARPGGRIVYSTCSLESEENEQVVAAVLASAPKARPIPMTTRIEEMLREGIVIASGAERLHRSVTQEGFLRLLPGALKTDGFFVALFEKG
ncbi:MAG: 16S rRNA (cytosine(967)-C(5))-methyltransferase RsmB [Terracidiphilus sp.]